MVKVEVELSAELVKAIELYAHKAELSPASALDELVRFGLAFVVEQVEADRAAGLEPRPAASKHGGDSPPAKPSPWGI